MNQHLNQNLNLKTRQSNFYSKQFSRFIVYELDRWSQGLKADFTLKHCLYEAVKLIKNTDPDKYYYSRYGIGFDSRSIFSVPNFDWVNNIIIFEVDNSSSVRIDDKKKDILVVGKGLIRRLNDTTITSDVECSIDFLRTQRNFV